MLERALKLKLKSSVCRQLPLFDLAVRQAEAIVAPLLQLECRVLQLTRACLFDCFPEIMRSCVTLNCFSMSFRVSKVSLSKLSNSSVSSNGFRSASAYHLNFNKSHSV